MNKFSRIGAILSFVSSGFILFSFSGLFIHDHHLYETTERLQQENDSLKAQLASASNPNHKDSITITVHDTIKTIETIVIHDTIRIKIPCPDDIDRPLRLCRDSITRLIRINRDCEKKLSACEDDKKAYTVCQDSLVIVNRIHLKCQKDLIACKNELKQVKNHDLKQIIEELCAIYNSGADKNYEKLPWYENWLKSFSPERFKENCNPKKPNDQIKNNTPK